MTGRLVGYMSVISGKIQKSFDEQVHRQLINHLERSWRKEGSTSLNTSSVAITKTGKYYSGLLESQTHLLDITSESAALALAVANKDPLVEEVITVVDGLFELNPLVIKMLIDHGARTGKKIAYQVFDTSGNNVFNQSKVVYQGYNPEGREIQKVKEWIPETNGFTLDMKKSINEQLFVGAIKGCETHFSSGTKSLYGAAVVAAGKMYWAGAYSMFDKRLMLHAEMVAALTAFADGKRDISHVGAISSKCETVPVEMCGCCRQFFVEIQQQTNQPIKVISFSYDGKKVKERMLSEYLPDPWTSLSK